MLRFRLIGSWNERFSLRSATAALVEIDRLAPIDASVDPATSKVSSYLSSASVSPNDDPCGPDGVEQLFGLMCGLLKQKDRPA